MSEPIAYLNGNWIPASGLSISAVDAGFVLGAAVAEQLRTFAGKIFKLQEHLDRLDHSLKIIGADPGLTRQQWIAIAQELVDKNLPLLKPGDDLGISIFATPGIYPTFSGQMGTVPFSLTQKSGQFPTYSPHEKGRPTVCLHAYPLPFGLWAEKYRTGQSLVTTEIQQVPGQCWPAELKCRSRMHYYLADKQAREKDPDARAVLLDSAGFITEAATANVVIYRKEEGIISPPQEKILPGISLSVLFELAGRLGIPCSRRDLTVSDLAAADEIILTSTPFCLLPVTRFNGRSVGSGRPGDVFCQLLTAWSGSMDVDIAAQAEQFARR